MLINIVYSLKKRGERITCEKPYYSDVNLGFCITMIRVASSVYDYAERCFQVMGLEASRECGVTMCVHFERTEKRDNFWRVFESLVKDAEKFISEIGFLSPIERHFLNCHPVITGTNDEKGNYIVFLRITIKDDLDRELCFCYLDDFGCCEISGDYGILNVSVWWKRKKGRDRLIRYLQAIGVRKSCV